VAGIKRRGVVVVATALAAYPMSIGIAWLRVAVDGNTPSKVMGTVARGHIEHAHVIPPCSGYVTYSFIGSAAGRQYVDGRVRDALTETFSVRSKAEGGRRFVMGETGDQDGRGRDPPDLALEQVRVRAAVRRAGRDGRSSHPVRERHRLPAGG
jgi:penicillin-insensitive murein endopeptidase